jgi:hypothetical protein
MGVRLVAVTAAVGIISLSACRSGSEHSSARSNASTSTSSSSTTTTAAAFTPPTTAASQVHDITFTFTSGDFRYRETIQLTNLQRRIQSFDCNNQDAPPGKRWIVIPFELQSLQSDRRSSADVIHPYLETPHNSDSGFDSFELPGPNATSCSNYQLRGDFDTNGEISPNGVVRGIFDLSTSYSDSDSLSSFKLCIPNDTFGHRVDLPSTGLHFSLATGDPVSSPYDRCNPGSVP